MDQLLGLIGVFLLLIAGLGILGGVLGALLAGKPGRSRVEHRLGVAAIVSGVLPLLLLLTAVPCFPLFVSIAAIASGAFAIAVARDSREVAERHEASKPPPKP